MRERLRIVAPFDGIVTSEPGPAFDAASKNIDRTTLIYYMPAGTGEHNMIRASDEGSETDNDAGSKLATVATARPVVTK